jgi:iron complex transport system ATP-binding protein
MKSLRARDVSFAYGERLVLDQISLDLRAGEVTVLLGANGAGKTTLLRTLCRQLQPDRGSVLIDEQDIGDRSRKTLARQVALMPQHEDRGSQLSVRDVVSLGRAPHCGWWWPMTTEDHKAVDQALRASGLWELRLRSITELSGGEWRRMILARALAQQAPILLLDEPAAGLDLKYQMEVLTMVQRMAVERQMVIVMTLHDLHHASLFADRLALISGNALLAAGTPREVLRPHLIEQAFGVPVTVIEHPVHGTPLVVPQYRPFKTETDAR